MVKAVHPPTIYTKCLIIALMQPVKRSGYPAFARRAHENGESSVKNLSRLNVAASLASLVGVAAAASTAHAQSGLASIYSGGRTANGEIARSSGLTAAHRTLPFGTLVRVTNRRSGRSVVVRINDRGPFIRGRIIDLAPAAARVIGCRGLAPVTVVVVGPKVDHRVASAPSRPVRANVPTLHTAAVSAHPTALMFPAVTPLE